MSSTSILQPAVHYGPIRRQQLRTGPRGSGQRRALLEARWRDTLERITALSIAYHDAAQLAPAGVPTRHGASSRQARRLARQAVAERQTLAEIEAALERITEGRNGRCDQCGRLIATRDSRQCTSERRG